MKKLIKSDGDVKVVYHYVDKYDNVIEEKLRYHKTAVINEMRKIYLAECNHNDVVAVNAFIIGE